MERRTLLRLAVALPLAPLPLGSAWARDAGELRIAGTPRQARALQARTGIASRAICLSGAALVDALDAGHIEGARIGIVGSRALLDRMGERIEIIGKPGREVILARQVLPEGLKADILSALA